MENFLATFHLGCRSNRKIPKFTAFEVRRCRSNSRKLEGRQKKTRPGKKDFWLCFEPRKPQILDLYWQFEVGTAYLYGFPTVIHYKYNNKRTTNQQQTNNKPTTNQQQT